MRIFFLIVFLAGAALAGGYPWYINNLTGFEFLRTTIHERGGAWKPVTARLDPGDGQVRIYLDMTSTAAPVSRGDEASVGLTVDHGGKTVLAETVTWTATGGSQDAVQSTSRLHRGFGGSFRPEVAGDYVFRVVSGGDDAIPVQSVDIVLRAQTETVDMRYVHTGIAILPIGVIGFALTFRRRRGEPKCAGRPLPASPETVAESSPSTTVKEPAKSAPAMKWGRGDS